MTGRRDALLTRAMVAVGDFRDRASSHEKRDLGYDLDALHQDLAAGPPVEDLREKCGVFWNGRTPPGWAEIQRDDAYAAGVGGKGTEFHDEDAARLVCREAGVPESCAVWLSIEVWQYGTEVHIRAIDDPKRPEGDWTACVPAVVAYLAGLLDDEQLAKANAEGT